MHLRNIVGRHMGSTPYLPRWRESRVGYACSVLFVGLGFVLSFLVAQAQFPFSLPGVPLLCAVVVIALLWGIGPAAFAILLSLLALDYLAVPPFGTLGVTEWRSVLQLLTFALAGTGIAILAHRYDAAFWHLFLLEREQLVQERERALARERAMQSSSPRGGVHRHCQPRIKSPPDGHQRESSAV